jgi:hypothetical protein
LLRLGGLNAAARGRAFEEDTGAVRTLAEAQAAPVLAQAGVVFREGADLEAEVCRDGFRFTLPQAYFTRSPAAIAATETLKVHGPYSAARTSTMEGS